MNPYSTHTMSDDPTLPLENAAEVAQTGPGKLPVRKRPKPGERRSQILQTLASMLELPAGERITTSSLARPIRLISASTS